MDINEFLDRLENSTVIYKGNFHQEVLVFLITKYKKLKKFICVLECDVSRNSHQIILKANDSFFFELDFNHEDIHLIINHYEEVFFFDNDFFILNYQNIFNRIFNGEYTIIESSAYFSTYTRLYFDEEVATLNRDILSLRNKRYYITKGEVLVDL